MTWLELAGFIFKEMSVDQMNRPALFFADEYDQFHEIQTTSESDFGFLSQIDESCIEGIANVVFDTDVRLKIGDWFVG